ncbi:geranylgeranyl diphosphate synthase type I [Archangium gephyra]|uniref:Geranylgeranyl diphosphate synthase type I n=1 Tax=Archangium gephyra TaxID=48 RepID=A0AAC8Q3F2_9BACT|nr:polyprenyl synthetase family protein [Archangium gephyra]AKJ00239.1 Octaprenyl diphosphate synthase [Archangium gephyra]REG33061.1 geranylgeranyl diphosphate synthase type I [Archangium gephyra]
MGLTPFTVAAPMPAPSVEQAWLQLVQARVDASLTELLELPDESRLDIRWTQALGHVREYVSRPTWRVRPALLLAGYCLARGSASVPAGLWRFAAGLELLHACMAIHDDTAEQSVLRRGGLTLHHQLAPGATGQHLSVVVGDHLFARAMETLLGSELPGATQASQYYLKLCRYSAVGRYVELQRGGACLSAGGVLQAWRLARLRMVREGLAPALVCGAMLAGADAELRLRLARVGCHVGLAYELREELLGLFGEARVGVRAPRCDFLRGRRTFPVVAAWSRALPEARRELETLWSLPTERRDEPALGRMRRLVEESGGRSATEHLVTRATHGAVRALAELPNPNGLRELVQALIGQLAQRIV